MLDEDIIIATGKKQFDLYVKEYFVNMTKNARTLHKTNCKYCQYSHCAYSFIPFDSIDEVEKYEQAHENATPFRRCGNCFKKR